MTIRENCHRLFFQRNLTLHECETHEECDICHAEGFCANCDCGIALLNLMQLIRTMFGHLMEIEMRLQSEQPPAAPVALWRPGGVN